MKQRELDHEREARVADRRRVVADREQCLIEGRVVERGDVGELRRRVGVEQAQSIGPVTQALPRLIDDEVCLDERREVPWLHACAALMSSGDATASGCMEPYAGIPIVGRSLGELSRAERSIAAYLP